MRVALLENAKSSETEKERKNLPIQVALEKNVILLLLKKAVCCSLHRRTWE